MPRTDIAVTKIVPGGVAPAAHTAGIADGHMFVNNGRTWVEVTNTNGTVARTITFVTPGTVGDRAIEDRSISIPATATRRIGPFDTALYNQAAGQTNAGRVYLNHDAAAPAETTVAAYTV